MAPLPVTPRILVSGCLLGEPIRYNATAKPVLHPLLETWRAEGRLVPLCPEILAGFATPRPPAEIAEARTGEDVLDGFGRVCDDRGIDITDQYLLGARRAADLAREQGCRFALLSNRSPSCGVRLIYDGSFAGTLHEGRGVTAALLRREGLAVFTEDEVADLALALTTAW